MPTLEDHPLACIFPLMGDDDLAALAADIEANGLRDAVWLYEGKILDGRNRYRACRRIDADHRVEQYRGKDPLGFVISKNLHRRHLTESQRAMVAANIAEAKKGKPANLPIKPVTQAEVAERLQVSSRSVRDAVKVKADGVPELVAAVESGDATVSAAAEVAKLPKAEQKKAVKAGKVKETAAEKRAAKKKPAPPTEGELRADDVPAGIDPFAMPGKEADPEDPPLDPRFMPNAAAAVALAEKFRTWKAQLIALRTAVRKELPDAAAVMARRIDSRAFDAAVSELIETLDKNTPEHACPPCCGTGADDAGAGCKFCDGYGVVDRHHHGGLKARWKRTAARLAALTADAGGAA